MDNNYDSNGTQIEAGDKLEVMIIQTGSSTIKITGTFERMLYGRYVISYKNNFGEDVSDAFPEAVKLKEEV